MSNTSSWAKRAETHRYSQDDRMLTWKFTKELEPLVNKFLDDNARQILVVGLYNLDKEPWRMAAIISFRKYQLKIIEKIVDGLTEVSLYKVKLSKMKA